MLRKDRNYNSKSCSIAFVLTIIRIIADSDTNFHALPLPYSVKTQIKTADDDKGRRTKPDGTLKDKEGKLNKRAKTAVGKEEEQDKES